MVNMEISILTKLKHVVGLPVWLAVLLVFIVQTTVGGVVIYYISTAQVKASLNGITERVQAGIEFENGTWNISKYNADSEIPGSHRLYVFSSDGFVIDRWRPIAGYLNVSNFRLLLEYQTPQTIHTITDQSWRMYSRVVSQNDQTVGVITVSYFSPEESKLAETDRELRQTADRIAKNISVENGELDVSAVDGRLAPFDMPFQIVSQYNRILMKTNNANSMDRIPDFIDSTYVLRNMQRSSVRQVDDDQTGEVFLAMAQPLVDAEGAPRGVVIAAKSISHVGPLLKAYIFINVLMGAAGLLIAATIRVASRGRTARQGIVAATVKPQLLRLEDIKAIAFDKKECAIQINDHKIPITYATNQYYLCVALFSARKKKWETDELIERFGERHNHNSWRKIYDASVSVNRKAAVFMEPKFIINNNKTYQINSDLLDKIE